jgi:TetR/AcrR family transcriptional regulator
LKVTPPKQEHIVEAAIRRFAHFGIQKTTLTEIADDVAITKQALFYYFPDKPSLIAAVEEKVVTEYIGEVERGFARSIHVEEALVKLLEARKKLLEDYYMLVTALINSDSPAVNDNIQEVKKKMKAKELALVTVLLQRGMASGELKACDAEKTGALLLETLSAFAQCAIDGVSIPDPKMFSRLYDKQKEVLQLFYNGLKQ